VPAAVPVAATEQLAVPHENPDGQHPPPTSAPHEPHPAAHRAPAAPVAVPGTTTVTPSLANTVVSAVGGHDVSAQSRPTWQHPPPM
jgi:hypothetical protein